MAGIGLYGVPDFAVKSRTREIGVRVALGTDSWRISRLIVGRIRVPVAAGAVLGMAAYAALARWIQQVLYGITSSDPQALCFSLIFVTVALLPTAPILRALRIDPASALRHE